MTEKLIWEPRFSVGNRRLDQQHQELLTLCARAVDCLADESPAGREQLGLVLDQLCGRAHEHFTTEESLLDQHNYPGLAEHRAEHHQMRVQLLAFLSDVMNGIIDPPGLQQFLSEWWSTHILESDLNYSKFLALRPRLWL